jgi:hypothetical protein
MHGVSRGFRVVRRENISLKNKLRQQIFRNKIVEEERTFSVRKTHEIGYPPSMDKAEQRFVIKYFWTKGRRAKRIHQELMTKRGNDADVQYQIKNVVGEVQEWGDHP